MCSLVSDSLQLFATLWIVARQAPLSMEFSRQGYYSELPFSSPGKLPHPGVQPMFFVSPALAGGFFTTAPPGKPLPESRTWKITMTKNSSISGLKYSIGQLPTVRIEGSRYGENYHEQEHLNTTFPLQKGEADETLYNLMSFSRIRPPLNKMNHISITLLFCIFVYETALKNICIGNA